MQSRDIFCTHHTKKKKRFLSFDFEVSESVAIKNDVLHNLLTTHRNSYILNLIMQVYCTATYILTYLGLESL